MIKNLQIVNYAIIEKLEITFSNKLTIITGETGAGKSIMLGALGLIMGGRADSKSLYDASKKCIIEGTFALDDSPYWQNFFIDNDLDFDEELIIRREISPAGKSRAFVNDTPVNLKVLQLLSAALIDLHQQFDTLNLDKQSFQFQVVDSLAGTKDALNKYQTVFKEYQKNTRLLSQLEAQKSQALKEAQFIEFQLNELHEAEIDVTEIKEMEGQLNQLTSAEETKQNLQGAYQLLFESESAIVDQLRNISNLLAESGENNPEVATLAQRFTSTEDEITDIGREIERLAENTEYNEEAIILAQERLDKVYRLQQKHQVSSVEELAEIQAELEAQVGTFNNLDEQIAATTATIATLHQQIQTQGTALNKKRKKVIPSFEKSIKAVLKELAMPNARLIVEFSPLETPSMMGLENVEFMFAANKGGSLQPVRNVASGGEMSRLALATKSLVAGSIALPTLIFDEIDTGISGDVALKMGEILKSLSNQHQVISITHSPQIAAKADTHYFVYKKDTAERTITKAKILTEEEKVKAIAVMLSQNPPSDSAIENAKELLAQ